MKQRLVLPCALALWAAAVPTAAADGARASPAANSAASSSVRSRNVSGADWAVSADGALVIDLKSRLVWPRCVEGMSWNGKTCTGSALLLDRSAAAARASARWKVEGLPWRLPRAPELQRLADRVRTGASADAVLFPAAPLGWHWTSTANVAGRRGNPYNYGQITQQQQQGAGGSAQMELLNGWAVNLATGEARGDAARTSKLPVRLVRAAADADVDAAVHMQGGVR